MNAAKVTGYAKSLKRAYQSHWWLCVVKSAFALIQHENITMQMHSQPGASNLAPKVLSAQEIIDKKTLRLSVLKLK